MKKFKIIAIVSLLALVFSILSFCLIGCKEEPTVEKKAIIMLPGFGGSIFIDPDLDAKIALVDDQNGNLNVTDLLTKILVSDKLKNMGLEAYAEYILGCDEDGKIINEIPVCNMNTGEDYIDSELSIFRPIRQYLEANYSQFYDIIVWQFDYRKSMEITALDLENFINSNGYDKVIFYTHSMGGAVVANYLVKEENRAKVELFVPVAAPLFGTYGSEGYIVSPLEGFSYPITESFVIDVDVNVTGILSNMTSIYEMLPNEGFEYTGNNYYFLDNQIITAEQAHNLLAAQKDWFWKLDSEGNRIEPKPMMGRLKEYTSKFWVNSGDEIKFITDLVPVEYVAMRGISTVVGLNYRYNGGFSVITSLEGDSTVSVVSATVGHPLDSANVHIVDGVSHINIFEDPVTEVLISIAEQYIPTLNAE